MTSIMANASFQLFIARLAASLFFQHNPCENSWQWTMEGAKCQVPVQGFGLGAPPHGALPVTAVMCAPRWTPDLSKDLPCHDVRACVSRSGWPIATNRYHIYSLKGSRARLPCRTSFCAGGATDLLRVLRYVFMAGRRLSATGPRPSTVKLQAHHGVDDDLAHQVASETSHS